MAVTSYVVYVACSAYGGRALLRAFERCECFGTFVESGALCLLKHRHVTGEIRLGEWDGDRGFTVSDGVVRYAKR